MGDGRRARTRIALAAALGLLAAAGIAFLLLSGAPDGSSGIPPTAMPDGYARENLGMVLLDIGDSDAAYYSTDAGGVYVLAVIAGSEAERAGVQAGDRVVAFNGAPCSTTAIFSGLLSSRAEAKDDTLTVLRGETALTLSLPDSAT